MKDIPNLAHRKILETLKQYGSLDYGTLASLTGMTESSARGRVSELRQMGYKINSDYDKDTKLYRIMLEELDRNLNRPITQTDKYNLTLKSTEDYNYIADLIDSFKKIKPGKIKHLKIKGPKYALLVLSDLHIGEVIKDPDTNQVFYNTEIAKKRLELLNNKVLTILSENNLKTLNIAILGDVIDGDMIFKNHTFRIEKAAIDQVQDAVTEITKFVRNLEHNKISVNIFMVRGNHGIVNYNNLEEDNWDNVCYKMLEIVFDDDPNVHIVHYQSSEGNFRIGERNIVITHGERFGEQIKTAAGLRAFRGVCIKNDLSEGDLVVIGHLHTFGIEYDQGKMLIRNGGLPDTSNYALALNLYSSPEQTLIIFDDVNPYPTIYPIDLVLR